MNTAEGDGYSRQAYQGGDSRHAPRDGNVTGVSFTPTENAAQCQCRISPRRHLQHWCSPETLGQYRQHVSLADRRKSRQSLLSRSSLHELQELEANIKESRLSEGLMGEWQCPVCKKGAVVFWNAKRRLRCERCSMKVSEVGDPEGFLRHIREVRDAHEFACEQGSTPRVISKEPGTLQIACSCGFEETALPEHDDCRQWEAAGDDDGEIAALELRLTQLGI